MALTLREHLATSPCLRYALLKIFTPQEIRKQYQAALLTNKRILAYSNSNSNSSNNSYHNNPWEKDLSTKRKLRSRTLRNQEFFVNFIQMPIINRILVNRRHHILDKEQHTRDKQHILAKLPIQAKQLTQV